MSKKVTRVQASKKVADSLESPKAKRPTRRQVGQVDDENDSKSVQNEKFDSTMVDVLPENSIFNSTFTYDKVYDEISDLEFNYPNSQASSQNCLTQIIPQGGKFTYHLDFKVENWEYLSQKPFGIHQIDSSKTLFSIFETSQDHSFFHLIKENMMTDQFKMLSENLIKSLEHFYLPSARNINFLRKYLRLYRKLSVKLFGKTKNARNEFIKVSFNYLKFFREFFDDIAFPYWKQSNIMELFHFSKEEQYSYSFFFNLCGHLFYLCLKHKHFDLDSNKALPCDLVFAFEFFEIVMNFLIRDFDQFMNTIGFYSTDIDHNVADTMPIIVRMIWQNKNPDYVSSVFKHFITHVVKCFNLKIYKMLCPMMKLFTRLSEAIRICAGNVRPYNAIYSLRVSVADELIVALQKDIPGVQKELDLIYLKRMANFTTQLPWLHQQFFVAILKRFINLTQYFNKRKYKLSLKMIFCLYLAGDVDSFKCDATERLAKQVRQSLINQSKSDFLDCKQKEDLLENNKRAKHRKRAQPSNENMADKAPAYLNTNIYVSNLEVIYRRYSLGGEKTTFGGNSMHIACRRGDFKWIKDLWELVDPNLPDSQGYTPLNDATRFGHARCVKKIIKNSNRTGLQLDFEMACNVDGSTPLHNAIKRDDENLVRLILESGGKHLLKIRMNSGESAEDLLSESLKDMVSSIDFKKTLNLLPKFENYHDAELYTWLVASLIESYLETNQLWPFVEAYKEYHTDATYLNQQVTDEDIRIQFDKLFPSIWGRFSTEEDLDALIDDFKVLHSMPQFIETFTELCLTDFNYLPNYFEPVLEMIQRYNELWSS